MSGIFSLLGSLQFRKGFSIPHIIIHKAVKQARPIDELCGGHQKGAVDLRSAAEEPQRSNLCKRDAAQEHHQDDFALPGRCT